MRVTTYIQAQAASRRSVLAHAVFAMIIVLGSSAVHTAALHFAPELTRAVNIAWLALYVVAFVALMIDQGINWISWMARYRILLVLLLSGTALSISWSISPMLSAERVVHITGCSIMAVYVGFMLPLLSIMRSLAVILAMLMFASIAVALALPDMGIQSYEGIEVWSGVMNSKNLLGFWAAVGVLLYLALSDFFHSLSSKAVCYGMSVLCLGVLAMSQSATSLLSLLVGGALSLYLFIAIRFQLGFIRMTVLAALFIGVVALGVGSIDTASIVGRSGDLTGRAEVWRQTWGLIMQQPLTGFGYGTIWFPNDATLHIQQSLTDFTWVVYHAHNGFLQLASEIGLPLSCIALLMVAQQLIEIFYCQQQRQQAGVLFVLAFVVAYLVSNFSEARFLVNRELYWILFIALPISMLRQTTLEFTPADERPSDNSAGTAAMPWRDGVTSEAQGTSAGQPARVAASQAYAVTVSSTSPTLVQHLCDDARRAYEEDLMRQFAVLDLHSPPDIDLGTASSAVVTNELLFDEDLTLDISSPAPNLDGLELPANSRAPAPEADGFDAAEYGVAAFDDTTGRYSPGSKGFDEPGASDDELVADFPLRDESGEGLDFDVGSEAVLIHDPDVTANEDDQHWLDEVSENLQRGTPSAGAQQPDQARAEQHPSASEPGQRAPTSSMSKPGGIAEDPSLDFDDTFDPEEYGVYHFDGTGKITERP